MWDAEQWLFTYLLNSLWQVPLFCLAALLLSRMLRGFPPKWVHRLWVGTFFFEVIIPALSSHTWSVLEILRHWVPGAHRGSESGVSVTLGPLHATSASFSGAALHICAAIGGSLWLYFLLRLIWRYLQTRHLSRSAQPIVLYGRANEIWEKTCVAFELSEVSLAQSSKISGPMTLGLHYPRVLLPEGWLALLPEPELLTIFAHELAHIHRRDFATNLLYETLALPIAYHPAYLLTRSRLIESREWVCDALASEAAAGCRLYAQSLLRLAERLLQSPAARVPHAIGIFDANTLERRIMNLTTGSDPMSWRRRIAALTVCMTFGLAACGSAGALGAKVAAATFQTDAVTPNEPHRALQVSASLMAGQLLARVNPIYPPEARKAGIEGSVVLAAVIGADGNLESLRLVSGPPEFTHSAWEAVSQWVYKPYLLNGEPTRVETTITVNYKLNR